MRVVATAGHVDHGKSTLLRALTGMEPDRWDEERERGLTIDLGFVWCDLAEDLTVAFVDVPGHERFVANMLAGAGAVRLALLVVAATDGWSAQSQEHLDILDLLGVSAAVVAITKTVPAGHDRSAEVAADVAQRLVGTTLEAAPIVTVDSPSGAGLGDLRTALTERLGDLPDEPDRGRPRLWVDRSFSVSGAGTVVTGTLTGGRLATGQEVLVLPAAAPCRIRGLQALGRRVEVAAPGSRVAVNLSGVDRGHIGRGDAVLGVWAGGRPASARDVADAWRATREVDVWVRALPGAEIGRRGAWQVHTGSAQTGAAVHPLLLEPATGGSPIHARLQLEDTLPLVSGDRLVLRETGRRATLGGGTVLDPDPPPRPRGTDARLVRAGHLDAVRDAADAAGRLTALLAAGGGARPHTRAHAAVGTDPTTAVTGVTAVGHHLCLDEAVGRWTDAVTVAATAAGAGGASRRQITDAAAGAGCPPDLATELADALAERGDLVRAGSTYVAPGFASARDEERRRHAAELLRRLDSLSPPPLADAARTAEVTHEELNALVQNGDVVVCGEVAFARSAVERAAAQLRALPSPFTTSQARAALGTSRRYAVPLLEHLDAAGVTVFDGTARRLT